MRLNIATSLTSRALAPALTHGLHIPSSPVLTRAPVSLAARHYAFPLLRRSDLLSGFDHMFNEMDELMDGMMANSLMNRFSRPSHSLLGRKVPGELTPYRQLGFVVTEDEKTYKVAVRLPDMEPKDIDLQLDHDGHVIRLKGDRTHEDGGIKVRSRFEKSILLRPDVDAEKLTASMSRDTLTVVAPKIEKKASPEAAENKKIEITFVQPEAASKAEVDPKDDTEKVPTIFAAEDLKP